MGTAGCWVQCRGTDLCFRWVTRCGFWMNCGLSVGRLGVRGKRLMSSAGAFDIRKGPINVSQ